MKSDGKRKFVSGRPTHCINCKHSSNSHFYLRGDVLVDTTKIYCAEDCTCENYQPPQYKVVRVGDKIKRVRL